MMIVRSRSRSATLISVSQKRCSVSPSAGLLLAAALLSSAAPVRAQPALSPEREDASPLEVITVTARRVAEDAQDVPIALTVLDSDATGRLPATASNAAIARTAPNFAFVDNGGQYANVANMRGVGSLFVLSPDDMSVPFNMDEIPLSPLGISPSTLDISRIEILRGPQGTLYGRNSQGGAVNFVPNRPLFDTSIRFRVEAGSRDWGLAELVANTVIVPDRLAGRLALQFSRRDGDVHNAVAGGRDGRTRVGAARGSLLFTPDTETNVILAFHHQRRDDTNPLWVLRDADCFPCSGLDPRNDFRRRNSGMTLRIERDLGDTRFTSLSSFQRTKVTTVMDLTDSILFPPFLGLPGEMMNDPEENISRGTLRERNLFQEFRLSSRDASPVNWTAGVNFFGTRYKSFIDGRSITWSSFRGYSGLQNVDFTANSYAAFGEVTVPLAGGLRGIAGLRITHEDKDARYDFVGSGIAGTVSRHQQHADFSDTFATGRIGLTYDWSDGVMSYATIGRGAVAGGLTTSPRNIQTGLDERIIPTSTSLTYEAGLKSNLWGGHAMLNLSLFFNDVERGRLMTFNAAEYAFVISTLDYESRGAELEARVRIGAGLTLSAGIGYTDAALKKVPADTLTGARSGNRLPNVPEWTGNLGAEYRVDGARLGLGDGEYYAGAAYEYVGVRTADLQNSLDVASYGLVNARIGWQGSGVGIYLFANNLTDRRYEAIGVNYGPGAEAVRTGDGRTVGIGVAVDF
jgi:iron complex outermembrane receptor protein